MRSTKSADTRKRKAVYFEILEYTRENLRLLHDSFDVVTLGSPADLTEQVLQQAEILFAPLGHQFDQARLERCPQLMVIATNTTGTPHIDVDYAESCGIRVISLKDEREFLQTVTPTAELTIGLIIAVTRNLFPAANSVQGGTWRRWDFGGRAMLSRMSLGVVGLGRLGGMVANYARAMGMDVSFYDPHRTDDPSTSMFRRSQSLEELVARCDISSIHIPMNEANRHLFGRELFAHFRRGAYLINTARGEIVDSTALVQALDSKQLAGAALDVLDGEFEPGFDQRVLDHPLVKYSHEHHNLIITPHIAGSTRDAWHMTQRHTIEQAVRATAGRRHGG